jgi:hypothetical protein
MLDVVVPKLEDKDFKKLERLIDAEFEADYVPFVGEANEDELNCFQIVQERVRSQRGKMIVGWQIWKTQKLIEAEFHAVWEAPNGNLIDIAPKAGGVQVEQILFIEDPRYQYEGKQVDSIRLNITSNKLVNHLIATRKAEFAFMNRGKRAFLYGKEFNDDLTDSEKKEYQNLQILQSGIYFMIQSGRSIDSLCFCRSKKKYKNCHGHNIKAWLSKY